MAALYPAGIATWVPRTDITDIVYAGDINSVYTEITGLESALGLNLLTSTWTGSFTQGASWASLSARLINIERGVVDSTSNIHPQYLRTNGSNSMSSALPMSSNKITGLANGTTATDAATYGQVVLRDGTNNLTGNLSANSNKITGLAAGTSNGDSVRYEEYAAVKTTADNALQRSGGTMTGPIAMGGSNKVTGLAAATTNGDAVRYEQAVLLAGSTMTGALTLSGAPSSANHAATKAYVDTAKAWCQGVRNESQSFPTTEGVITYTSKTDASGMLNASTGIVTISTTGLWTISLYALCTTPHSGVQYTIRRGTETIAASVIPSSSLNTTGAAYVGPLTSGDQITAYLTNGSTSMRVFEAKLGIAFLGTI